MKSHYLFRYCFFLCILLSTTLNNCRAQDTLFADNKIWSILTFDYAPKKNAQEYPKFRTHFIKAEADGDMDNPYKYRLLRSDNESMSEWYDYGSIMQFPDQRIYYSPPVGSGGLLYDFGAEEGDTVRTYDKAMDYILKYRVDSIDTVLINGIERKRMQMKGVSAYDKWYDTWFPIHYGDTWISGIGSLSGIVYNNTDCLGCDSYYLLCAQYGDSLLYKRGNYSSCYYSTVGVPETSLEDEPVEIFPNPVNSGQEIQIRLNMVLQQPGIVMYNSMGKQLDSFTLENNVATFVVNQPGGLYFIRIMEGTEVIGLKKLVVH